MATIGPAQLSDWFDAFSRPLALYARQWLLAELADDVVQEVFVRLMSQPREPVHVKAWLFRSVRNAAISQVRSQQRRRWHEKRLVADRPGWFQSRPDDLIDAAAAQACLVSLPATQREAIVLRIWAGMTFQEIADVTGLAISTLHSQYRAGLVALRKKMEATCETNKH